MQLKVALIFVTLALVIADDCGDEKGGVCIERLLSVIMEDVTEEETCVELLNVVECLRNAADECLGEDRDPEVDRSLEELDNMLEANCPAKEVEKDEVEKCFEENQQYILMCIPESLVSVENLMGTAGENDMNVVKCTMYRSMTKCLTDRSEEKCGVDARKQVQEEMDDMPPSLKDACDAAETVSFLGANLLDRKRK